MARANSKPRKNEQKITQDRINELYRESGTSLTKMATSVGISPASLQNYTAGERTPDAQGIVKLCKAFNVSADWLLGLSDVKKPDADLSAVCEYTGLSESVISRIKNIDDPDCKKALSMILEGPNLLTALMFYRFYLHIPPHEKSDTQSGNTYTGEITLSPYNSAQYFLTRCCDYFQKMIYSDFEDRWKETITNQTGEEA